MDNIKRKTILSTLSLFFQSGYSAVLGFIANLILTILLTPKTFGIYFTVLSIIAILNYFSDIGLAASLIQKKEISDKEVKTVFTVQQILILVIILIGFLSTKIIIKFYNLPVEGQFLYHSLLISFFLSSLKTIPSVFLERKIQFQKIVLAQIIENTVFYFTVIFLALMGMGLTSFTIAVVLRAITGVILLYYLSYWKIQIGIDFSTLKKLLKFGVPFQMSSFLALIKDDLITLYLGKSLGFDALGLIGWAKKWAESPIRIIMDSISKVLFPLFSRFQEDKEKLKKTVEKVIYYQSLIVLPAIVGSAIAMEKLIEVIPKYSKWSPALPFFYIFCLSSIFSSYSTPFINLLNGLGKIKISFIFMLTWTILTWILTPILTRIFGGLGFPLTILILSSTFVIVIFIAKKAVNFSFLKNVYPFFISSIFMGGILFFILNLKIKNLWSLPILIAVGIISYNLILKVIFKINLLKEAKELWKTSRQ
ncbi:MAG: oligosaccharide flippase family protein [Microgenomates group bacterium]